MIRINLLPIRAEKKRESLRFHLTVAGLMLIMVIVASVGYTVKLGGDVSALDTNIENTNKDLAVIEKKIGELTNLKHQKSLVQNKLDTVDNLEKGRTGPVRIFNMVRDALPDKVWITTLKDNKESIALSGFAANKNVFAEFMERLHYYADVKNVTLKVLKSAIVNNVDVQSFSIVVHR